MRTPIPEMKFRQDGFGLFEYVSTDVIIAGGFRAKGFHGDGKVRLAFKAYGYPELQQYGQDASELAYLELVMNIGDPPTIDALIKIEVHEEKRRQGYGERVVAAVLGATGGDLNITDIQRSSLGFWKKMGIEFSSTQPLKARQIDGVLRNERDLDLDLPAPSI